jgi:competence protein ComEA
MKHRIVKLILVSLAIGMIGGLSRAADTPPANKGRTAAVPEAAVVDINSASRQELKKLPGIGNAEADRIIAGRPYLTKAHLQTREIVSPLVYQGLRDLVVARQKDARFAKVAGK